MKLQDMDLVYLFLLPDDGGEELRYSLRSVCENLPHRNIYIVGDKLPEWITGVKQVKVKDDRETRFGNTNRKLREVCKRKGLSDQFVLMNDDFFVLRHIESIPAYIWGSIDEHILAIRDNCRCYSHYMKLLENTRDWLREHNLPEQSYEIHAPCVLDKAELIETAIDGLATRTLYGNTHQLRRQKTHDFKIYSHKELWETAWPFVSTNNSSWAGGVVGQELRRRFSAPCQYEAES